MNHHPEAGACREEAEIAKGGTGRARNDGAWTPTAFRVWLGDHARRKGNR